MSAPKQMTPQYWCGGYAVFFVRPGQTEGQWPEYSLTGGWDRKGHDWPWVLGNLNRLIGTTVREHLPALTTADVWLLQLILAPSFGMLPSFLMDREFVECGLFREPIWRAVGWPYLVKAVVRRQEVPEDEAAAFVAQLDGTSHNLVIDDEHPNGFGLDVLLEMLGRLCSLDLVKEGLGDGGKTEDPWKTWWPANRLIHLLQQASEAPTSLQVVELPGSWGQTVATTAVPKEKPKAATLARVSWAEEQEQRGLYEVIAPTGELPVTIIDAPTEESLTGWLGRLDAYQARHTELTASSKLVLQHLLTQAAKQGHWCWCTETHLMRELREPFKLTPEAQIAGLAIPMPNNACVKALEQLVEHKLLIKAAFTLQTEHTGDTKTHRYRLNADTIADLYPE